MKEERRKMEKVMTVITAVLAVMLLAVFLVFCLMLFVDSSLPADGPVLGMFSGIVLLLGIAALLLIPKRKVSRLWRRLLIAGIVCNVLVILFFVLFLTLLLLSVQAGGGAAS